MLLGAGVGDEVAVWVGTAVRAGEAEGEIVAVCVIAPAVGVSLAELLVQAAKTSSNKLIGSKTVWRLSNNCLSMGRF